MSDLDLAAMLRVLADLGWKPVLYPETLSDDVVTAWVCYPLAPVRHWTSARASDPVIAVRVLYLHAQEHPNVAPGFTPSADAVARWSPPPIVAQPREDYVPYA